MLILSLPVIASAATNTLDNYSGYSANVVIRGFELYSTAKGGNAGMKPFATVVRAGSRANTLFGTFQTGGAGSQALNVQGAIGGKAFIDISWGNNSIAPKGGNVIRTNVYYYINYCSAGNDNVDLTNPTGLGQTSKDFYVGGSAVAIIYRNPKNGKMVMYLQNPAAMRAIINYYTSGSNGSGGYQWNYTGSNRDIMVMSTLAGKGVSIAPIILSPTPSSKAGWASWWD